MTTHVSKLGLHASLIYFHYLIIFKIQKIKRQVSSGSVHVPKLNTAN